MTAQRLPIDGVKRRAKVIGRERSIQHAKALDLAAQEAGFQNFAHARRNLIRDDAPEFTINIYHRWRQIESNKSGEVSLSIKLATPLSKLLKSNHFVGYLGGDKIDSNGNLVVGSGQFVQDDETSALERTKRVARALEFIEITGLRPSSARRCYPKGEWYNRPPIADHDHSWYDPQSGLHLLTTEPYPGRSVTFEAEMRAWEAGHGYVARLVPWGSIYGFRTELWLIGSAKAESLIERTAARLVAKPTQHPFGEPPS